MENNLTCSFSGHRPDKLSFGYNEESPECLRLKQEILYQIELLIKDGTNSFCSGMALGVDMWCAEAVIELKKKYSAIELNAIIPCKGQEKRWSAEHKARYNRILSECENVVYIAAGYFKGCMLERNRRLVDCCDVLLAVFDGTSGGTSYTVNLASKKGKIIIVIEPNTLEVLRP